MRRWLGALAALVVSGCAFTSRAPLFGAASAAFPFSDGARFVWREHPDNPREEITEVVYHRRQSGYEIAANGRGERPMVVMFVALPDTPEEDYIAQVTIDSDEPGRLYAFLWRSGDLYKIVAAPGWLEEREEGARALAQSCVARPNDECQFGSRGDVLDFYRRAVYPLFVAPDADPHGIAYQIPIGATAAPSADAKPGKR